MTERNPLILIVEDDPQIRTFILYALRQEGYTPLAADTGCQALSILLREPVELVILDLGLPDLDGLALLQKYREWSETPVIIVSARDQDREKVAALDAGADDYLTKPFSAGELMARIRVALRHAYRTKRGVEPTIRSVGALSIDIGAHIVRLGDEELHVTPLEFQLLSLFFQNIGKVLTTKTLLRTLYGPGYGDDTQALRTLIAGLRRKIEPVTAKPRYIKTEIGVGYRLVDE